MTAANEAALDRQVRAVQVTFDCADPAALAAFWCEVLGYQVPPPPGGGTWPDFLAAQGVPESQWNSASAAEDPHGQGPRLFFQRVPEGKTAKNRVHLDVRVAPGLHGEERMAVLEPEAERLVTLGATRVARHERAPPMSHGHVVLQDPEGNELCLD